MKLTMSKKAFVARGIASAQKAKKSGKYVPAATVLAKLDRRLAKARRLRASSG